jgi:hypothetical protein
MKSRLYVCSVMSVRKGLSRVPPLLDTLVCNLFGLDSLGTAHGMGEVVRSCLMLRFLGDGRSAMGRDVGEVSRRISTTKCLRFLDGVVGVGGVGVVGE